MPDPELQAMSAVADALKPLTEEERSRILRWSAERFGVQLGATTEQRTDRGGAGDEPEGLEKTDANESGSDYGHFAELFDAAGPDTSADKALVAGYWFQVVRNQDKFKSTELQTELKHLGHAVPNITEAMTANIKKKPARVLQIAKSGTSKQARKSYKLTREGQKHVEALISGATAE